MPLTADIKEQITDLITFKHIASAFTEAAAVKLASLRRAYARNDRFYQDITHIYHLVKANAQKKEMSVPKTEQAQNKLSIALTSNQRFFGIINTEIMIGFLAFSQKSATQKLVIGTTGQNYLRSINYKESYKSMTFRSDIPDRSETDGLLQLIRNYTQVNLFYPKYISIIRQEVGTVEITGQIPPSPKSKDAKLDSEFNLIFEPELGKILEFFETEVKTILLKRVFLETDLARTAARLLSMSQAEERTDHEIKAKYSELRKVVKSLTNAQLLETFSGIKKWKHGISERRTLAELKNKVLFFEHAN